MAGAFAAASTMLKARSDRRPCIMFFYSSKCSLCSRLKPLVLEQQEVRF
jgi:thioredoxin-related protein